MQKNAGNSIIAPFEFFFLSPVKQHTTLERKMPALQVMKLSVEQNRLPSSSIRLTLDETEE